jgi:hypothetical protein
MRKLSEKYVAGFLDADGSFGITILKKTSGYFPVLYLQFSQETSKNRVLFLLQETIGGTIHTTSGGRFTVLNVPPKQARLLLGRISKYLVIKRRYAEVVLGLQDTMKAPLSEEDKDVALQYLKLQRRIPETRLRNFPARKWLAGYFDGDGCIACSYHKTGRAYLSGRITCLQRERIGLELLQNAFGGVIYEVKKPHGTYPMWVVNLEPSKAKKFLGYFAKHSIVKKAQCYFVLGCANGGNYRDGKPIRDNLSRLKAQEQRLNDPEVEVSRYLCGIRFDIAPHRPATYAIVQRSKAA